MTPGQAPRFRFRSLDGLRAVAVLLVLGYDLRDPVARLHPPAAVQYLFDGGFVAVDLLFVLGGFLICRRLFEPSGGGLRPAGWLLRRFAPLHLVAWAVAFGWAAPGLIGTPSKWPSGWLSNWLPSAALLAGFGKPGSTSYPMAWALSMGFWTCVLLILLTAMMGVGRDLFSRLGPFGRAARFGRPTRIGPLDPFTSIVLAATIAVAAGAVLLLRASAVGYETGAPALGRGLLGLGTGMLVFLLVRARTGTLTPPSAQAFAGPDRGRPAGIVAGLALVVLLLCVYRSDRVSELHLLPVFPVAAALIFLLARDDETALHRALGSAPARWLGRRAFAFFVLHGAILITVERLNTDLSPGPRSTLTTLGILIEVLLGSLAAAAFGHRFLERLLAGRPAAIRTGAELAPEQEPAVSRIQTGPVSQPSPVSRPKPSAGAGAILPELRLRPLPSKKKETVDVRSEADVRADIDVRADTLDLAPGTDSPPG